MKTVIITAPFPVLERLRKEANLMRYFRVQEVPGQTQQCSIKINTGKETADICNFPSSLETQYIVELFWLKYKQIFWPIKTLVSESYDYR